MDVLLPPVVHPSMSAASALARRTAVGDWPTAGTSYDDLARTLARLSVASFRLRLPAPLKTLAR
eukprot:8692253-Pyramimonas_sp.AAC.1